MPEIGLGGLPATASRPTRPIRILVAHEPPACREALAAAIRLLRPGAEVTQAIPADADAAILRDRPDLVFCSRLSDAVRCRVGAWALIRPGERRRVVTCVVGERAAADDLDLAATLALVDRVASTLEANPVAVAPT